MLTKCDRDAKSQSMRKTDVCFVWGTGISVASVPDDAEVAKHMERSDEIWFKESASIRIELTFPFARTVYERVDDEKCKGFSMAVLVQEICRAFVDAKGRQKTVAKDFTSAQSVGEGFGLWMDLSKVAMTGVIVMPRTDKDDYSKLQWFVSPVLQF